MRKDVIPEQEKEKGYGGVHKNCPSLCMKGYLSGRPLVLWKGDPGVENNATPYRLSSLQHRTPLTFLHLSSPTLFYYLAILHLEKCNPVFLLFSLWGFP